MEELVYFTQRAFDGGEAMVWVFRNECPKCKDAIMGKPRNDKGKAMTRAKEYACPKCDHRIEKQEYEDSLVANAEYTCAACNNQGEAQIPFKRKVINGIQTLRFQCGKCEANIDVTKKMKEKKEK